MNIYKAVRELRMRILSLILAMTMPVAVLSVILDGPMTGLVVALWLAGAIFVGTDLWDKWQDGRVASRIEGDRERA